MNCSAAILTEWWRNRLLQAALAQAERLAEMALEVEALRSHNSSLHRQLEVNGKRSAELQGALEAAQRAAYRQAAPFRIEARKRTVAPRRPGRQRGGRTLFLPTQWEHAVQGPVWDRAAN